MARKTNAVRLLERAGIDHELRGYDISMEEFSAEAVAELIGLPARQVFKTLVARGAEHPCFAVVPGDTELDLKALATGTGERKMTMMPLREVEPLTGYRRGGVTVLGARKPLPVFIDRSVESHDTIGVSAGVKGLQIVLAPADYVAVTGATVIDLVSR